MSLRKTAGLAAMLMSFSLAVPAQGNAADNWNNNFVYEPDADGIVSSSGTKENVRTETPDAAVYNNIYIGNAQYKGEDASKIVSSYNKGIIQAGVTAESTVYGGRAYYDGPLQSEMTVAADGNTLVLQKGSNAWGIYGADAYDPTRETGSVSASNNTVVIEGGNTLSATRIYGAYANSNGWKIASTSVASGNTVIINEGVTLERTPIISGGTASDSSAEASGNKVYVYSPADSKILSVWAGDAKGWGGTCKASNNVCELVLGDTEVTGNRFMKTSGAGEALNQQLYHCDTEANANSLRVTGGTFAVNLFSGLAYGSGSESYSEDKLVADGNTAVLNDVLIYKSFASGYAGFSGMMKDMSASGNTASLTGCSVQEDVYGGCVSGYSLFYDGGVSSELSVANKNELSLSGSTAGYVYGGSAFSEQNAVASDNRLVKIENTVISSEMYGGYARGTSAQASGNTGTLENVTFPDAADASADGFFAGGWARATETGGKVAEALASYNKTEINGGTLAAVYGGRADATNSGSATAYGNELAMSDTTVLKAIYGGSAVTSTTALEEDGAVSGSAQAAANRLILSGGSYGDNMYGGYAAVYGDQSGAETSSTATAESNEVSLANVTVQKDILGGFAECIVDTELYPDGTSGDAAAKSNKLALSGGTYGGSIFGGYASVTSSAAEASKNMLYLNCTQDASGTVSLLDTSSVVSSGNIYGGSASGITAEASGNRGALNKVQADKSSFTGGCAVGAGGETIASENSFSIEDSSFTGVCGGQALSEQGSAVTADSNALVLTRVTVQKDLYGGYAGTTAAAGKKPEDASAKSNTLSLYGGTYGGSIYGGYAASAGSTADASHNRLYLNSAADDSGEISLYDDTPSDISGYLFGGSAEGATAKASGNRGAVHNTAAEKGVFSGGWAEASGGEAVSSGNSFVITDSSFDSVYGGQAISEQGCAVTADSNELTLANVTVQKNLYGSCAESTTESGSSSAAAAASAKSNSLTIYGGTYGGSIYGGYASTATGTADASQNRLYLNSAADDSGEISIYETSSVISGYLTGGSAEGATAKASGNRGAVHNTAAEKGVFSGGWAEASGGEAVSSGNSFVITDSSFDSVYGGQAISEQGCAVTADSNELTLANVTVQKNLYGSCAESTTESGSSSAAAAASAKSNTLSLYGGTYGGSIYGGYASTATGTADASQNRLYLNSAADDSGEVSLYDDTPSVISGYLFGGSAEGATAKASGNRGAVHNVTADNGVFSGGWAKASGGEAVSSGNSFVITESSFDSVYGGQAISEQGCAVTADSNELTLANVTVQKNLYGSCAESTTESGSSSAAAAASAKSNTLSLFGGTYGGSIYGGYASTSGSTADAGGNTVGLYALDGVSPSFDSAATVIWGGSAYAGDSAGTSSGNTLKLNNVRGMTAANIMNFQNLDFSFTETLAANDVILELKGSEDQKTTTIAEGGRISVSVASVTGESGNVFRQGDKIILLKNDNGLDIRTAEKNITLENDAVPTAGVSVTCRLKLMKDESSLYLTGTSSLNSGTKAIAEGALAGLALAGESAVAASEAMDNMAVQADQGCFSFGSAHASSMTYESGSSISVSSVSMIAGIGSGFATSAGLLNVGAFFEYGKGAYTTHNDFSDRSGIDGDGTSWYMGGGILARMNFRDTGPGHFYVEGAAHMGSVHNEYDSNDLADAYGNVARFDMDSPYYSLHGGLGYVWNMAEGHELKMYGRYLWTMVQGTDETLSTSDRYEFDDMHSSRIRAGVRYSYTGSERFRPYIGVSYEHEFAGSCDARTYGFDVNSPSYEGGTGTGELGIAMMPADTLPLSFSLGVQGYAGKKQGISGNCNVMYEF